MPKRKPANWEDIKTRFIVNGEKPEALTRIYDVSARTIYNRCSREKWREEQLKIGKEIREAASEHRRLLTLKTIQALEKMADDVIEALNKGKMNVFQGNEGTPSKFHLEAWRALIAAALRDPQKPEDSETPMNQPIYRTIYANDPAEAAE